MAVPEKAKDKTEGKEKLKEVDPHQQQMPVAPPKEEKKEDAPKVNKTPELIAQLLQTSGVTLYRERSGFPLSQAQRNLEGKSHYADDVSLRDYQGKILSCAAMDEGLTLGIVESYQAWPGQSNPPKFRPVFFDVFGNVVYRPDPDTSSDSLKAAQAEFWKFASTIDPVALTMKGLEAKRQVIQAELDTVTKLMETLTK